jgi:TonB-linked SusC/RagA family outer membrane protein
LKDFYETGVNYKNTISVSGGNEKSTYYLSYGNENDNGIMPGNVDTKTQNSFRLNGTLKGNKLSSTASVNYISKTVKAVPTGQGGAEGAIVYEDLLQTPTDISVIDQKNFNNKYYNLNNYFTPYAGDPYRSLNQNQSKYVENRIMGNLSVKYEFTKWLSASIRSGVDVSDGHRQDYVAIQIPDSTGYNRSYQKVLGNDAERSLYSREINNDIFINFDHNITENIGLKGFVGYSTNERYKKNLLSEINQLDIPFYYNISNSSQPVLSTTYEELRRLDGTYAEADLSYKEMLFLTGNFRQDRSSTLPVNHNTYNYGAVSLSFLLSEAVPSIKDVLPFAKLRASYGRTGNDADPYSIYQVMVPLDITMQYGSLIAPLGGVNSFTVSHQIGNPNLTPELTYESELGTELKFFNNRLSIDFTYYDKTTQNLILSVPLPASSGYRFQVQNIGKVEDKGLEFMFGITPVKTANFQWDIGLNFSNNRNKVLSLTEGLGQVIMNTTYDIDYVARAGQPMGLFVGPVPLTDGHGHVVVNASTGEPIVDPIKHVYGSSQAKYLLGLNTQIKYKNLLLSCLFDIRQGGLMYSGTADLWYFTGNATQTTFNYRQPWLYPNSVVQVTDKLGNVTGYAENTHPIDMTNQVNNYYFTTNPAFEGRNVIDRSYVKLREVTLSYSFPKSMYKDIPISEIGLGIVGRNLLLWTPKTNNFVDPESSNYGNDNVADFGEFRGGPSVRTVGFDVKLKF